MIPGLLGQKLGMTQVFLEDGQAVPVTVLETGPCRVVQVKTMDRDGYAAVQVAFQEVPDRKASKPARGHFAKAHVPAFRYVREFRSMKAEGGPAQGAPPGPAGDIQVGATIKADIFAKGQRVDVIGVSKGKGFQGVMKRHHFRGGPESHGSMFHRAPGSIGSSSFPSRVWKNMRMAGHMGSVRVTVQGLTVVDVRPEENLILVRGAVPGARGSLVVIRKSKKA